ncbi:hypothetical protein BKA90DRAFT_140130 [Yarrowia lipolytica]|nr:hypothetical protein BKA90DRAFT_140130 [Yarrowia lipolytica]
MSGLLSLQLVITLRPLSACTEGFPFTRQLRSLRSASPHAFFTHGFNQSQQLRPTSGILSCDRTSRADPKVFLMLGISPVVANHLREGAPE